MACEYSPKNVSDQPRRRSGDGTHAAGGQALAIGKVGADRRRARLERARRSALRAAPERSARAVAASGVQARALPRRGGRLLPQPKLAEALRVRQLARRGRSGRAEIGTV